MVTAENWSSNKKVTAVSVSVLLMLVFLGALVYALVNVNIANVGGSVAKQEERIQPLEQKTELTVRGISDLKKASREQAADIEGIKVQVARHDEEIKAAVNDHEKRLHSKKVVAKKHGGAEHSKPKQAKMDASVLIANVVKSCADRGGELVSENGKATCVTKVAQPPAQDIQPKVARLDTSKVGTPCHGGDRSATYQIINGQIACLLDGVVRLPVRVVESIPAMQYYRPAPEVVYVDRPVAYEQPQGDVVYYEEEPQQPSSWVPWAIGATALGAVWWDATRNRAPAVTGGGLINLPIPVLNGIVNPPIPVLNGIVNPRL
ncbi:MAG: hypothetical protein HZB12_00415 [Candidatus Yonathbacteria bacterium]|nr:hypothetical protein [Candidatus Yonathbacteria bacterium]